MVENEKTCLIACAERLGIPPDDLVGGLNLTEAARLLGIAPSTLRSRALNGHIGSQRDGSRWIFCWWHIDPYLHVREQEPLRTARNTMKSCGRQRRTRVSAEIEGEAKTMGLI